MSSEPDVNKPLPPTTALSTADLVALLYRELRSLAEQYFRSQPQRHTLQPTALVHEVFLKLSAADQTLPKIWQSKTHFFAYAATAMRSILVDHARRHAGRPREVTVDGSLLPGCHGDIDVVELHEAIDRYAIMESRGAQVIVLRFFAGLTIEQTAAAMEVSDFTVERDWRLARAWLARELRMTSGTAGGTEV